ncbi:hypothetical protein CFOL_v3_29532 [Cephalotus follicularis]|uniref:Uncharacterized protein n=1 Tax=Cephalotus follicularis TaxID=3775 RepID=A0A1Q3D0T5_CEPFO|nr:hypothetical protein CFOL_v3_29532 [Cephalotus follicularis]
MSLIRPSISFPSLIQAFIRTWYISLVFRTLVFNKLINASTSAVPPLSPSQFNILETIPGFGLHPLFSACTARASLKHSKAFSIFCFSIYSAATIAQLFGIGVLPLSTMPRNIASAFSINPFRAYPIRRTFGTRKS